MTQQVISSAGAIKETNSFGNAGYGTSLPASPTDGMEYILVDSVTVPTYQWLFRYNNGSSQTDKWEFVGGAAAIVSIETSETQGTSAYAALATAGPSFTVPRAGQYIVSIGCNLGGGGTGSTGYMSYDIGGTGAVDADAAYVGHAVATNAVRSVSVTRSKQKTIAAASTALVSKYRNDSGTWTFASRWISVAPIRVS